MDKFSRFTFTFLATLAFVNFSFPVSAQEDTVEIEEVIVEATRRAESIQDIALSVQALSDEDLADAQIADVSDLTEYIPGFNFYNGLSSGVVFSIRGSAPQAIGANSVDSVQAAINGHTVLTADFGEMGFLDLERLEILAGPQGTLYGRNVVGGLVNAITARPTGDNSGFARMEYGNFASSRLQTAVNLPLTDSISARVAYGSYSKDGTTMNEYTGNEVDGRDEWGARISVDFDLGDLGVLQLTSDIREIDDNRLNIAGQYCAADPFYGCSPFEQGPFGGIYHLAGTIGGGLGQVTFLSPSANGYDPYVGSPRYDDFDRIYESVDPFRKQDFQNTQLEYIRDFDSGTVKVKHSYMEREYLGGNDNDHSHPSIEGFNTALGIPFASFEGNWQCWGPSIISATEARECAHSITERNQTEINWISDLDGPVNFTLGAYLYESDYLQNYHVQTTDYQMLASFDRHPYSDLVFGGAMDGYGGFGFWNLLFANAVGGLQAGMPTSVLVPFIIGEVTGANAALGGALQNTLPPELSGLRNDSGGRQKSKALFGELYYKLDDVTTLTVGARYDEYSAESTEFNSLADAQIDGQVAMAFLKAAQGTTAPVFDRNTPALERAFADGSDTSVKLAIEREFGEDAMAYLLYSTAVKPGGNAPNASGSVVSYDESTVDNIELGLRSILAGGRLLFNTTLYQLDTTDGHYSFIIDSSTTTQLIDHTTTGFEMQMKALLSENSSLEFNLLSTDSEIGAGEALFDPLNINGATTTIGAPVGAAGLGNMLLSNCLAAGGDIATCSAQVNAAVTGIAANFGPLFGLANFQTTDTGVVAKLLGSLYTLPGLSAPALQDLEGNRMPGAIETDLTIAYNHSFALSAGALDVRATYVNKSGAYADIFNTDRYKVPPSQVFDLLTTYTPNDGDWYVGGYVKNIGDKRHLTSIQQGSVLQGGVLHATFTQPRTYGVRFGINF